MADNRTTELRGKLTERGVEYRGDDASYTFATHWADSLGRGCSFVEEVYDGESKTMFVSEPSARNITPEQAIAATLGSEPDETELTQIYDVGFRNGVMAVFQQLEGIESYEELQDLIAEYWGEGEGYDEP